MRLLLRAATLSLLLAACISASQGGTGSMAARDAAQITSDEIRASRRANALELVQALRPEWLRKRSNTASLRNARVAFSGSDDVMAYLDGQRLGTVETLRSIPWPTWRWSAITRLPAHSSASGTGTRMASSRSSRGAGGAEAAEPRVPRG